MEVSAFDQDIGRLGHSVEVFLPSRDRFGAFVCLNKRLFLPLMVMNSAKELPGSKKGGKDHGQYSESYERFHQSDKLLAIIFIICIREKVRIKMRKLLRYNDNPNHR